MGDGEFDVIMVLEHGFWAGFGLVMPNSVANKSGSRWGKGGFLRSCLGKVKVSRTEEWE